MTKSLSNEKVLVKAKAHPSAKALLIIGYDVVGGAEAKPNGFGILTPAISDEISTSSIGVQNEGNSGVAGT